MSDHYYRLDGLKNLEKLGKLKKELFTSFMDFNQKVFEEGALSSKIKELIAIGAAHITQCPYCIDSHVQRAKNVGATDGEIAEAIFVAMAMSAGAAVAHSCIAIDSMDR